MPSKAKQKQIKELLDCALAQRSDRIKAFLKDQGLPRSGKKADFQDRLEEFLEDAPDGMRLLTKRLNELDGWGNQHVYFYKSKAAQHRPWRNEAHVKKVLKANKVARLLNRSRPVVLPEEPTLADVQWEPSRLRLIWNETREWFERREDEDYEDDNGDDGLLYRAWERRVARGTVAFDWDLTTGEAMVMIQRLPSGTQYARMRDELINWLLPFVDLTGFQVVRVSPVIKKILTSGEVRERKTNWETVHGGKASFASAGKGKGVGDDATLKEMESRGKGQMQGSLGNMYWLPNGQELTDELHAVLVRKDQRLAILGHKLESEVRYVIGRIRSYCA